MSPEGPRFSPEISKDDKKDKKRKKNAPVPLPPLVALESSETEKTEKKEPSPLEKALADLAARRAEMTEASDKPEKSDKDEKEAEQESGTDEAPVVEEKSEKIAKESSVEPAEERAEAEEEQEGDEAYEALPTYDLEPTEFSGGEVIIHLNGDESIGEREIPLQPEAVRPTEPEEARETDAETSSASTVQPEQNEGALGEETPEPAAGGGGGEVPSMPPEYPSTRAEQPPERPQAPEVYEAEAIRLRDMAPFAPSSERPATKQDVEDALYYAEKAGQRRGVLAGLVAGGAYEHFKHKRRERKLNKQLKQQGKQLETARTDFKFGLQQETAAKAETERRLAAAEAAAALPSAETVAVLPLDTPPQPAAHTSAPEHSAPAQQSERRPSPEDAATKQPTNPEQLHPEEAEQLQIPADHRLETSAWHSIEVDARTGKPVEAPSFEYGREYHRERAHENLRDDETETAHFGAGSTPAGAGQSQNTDAEPEIPDATVHGESVKPADKAKAALSSVASGAASSGPLWPWLVALFVVVILLAILL